MSKKIFTVTVETQNPVHTVVSVFNCGGLSGRLTINTSDVAEFIRRVVHGVATIRQDVGTIESGTNVVGVKIERLG